MTSSRPSSSRIPNKEPNEVTTRVSSANVRKEKQPSVPQKATSNSNMFAYFWLDEDVNKTKNNQEIQKELRKIVNSLQTFENPNECEQTNIMFMWFQLFIEVLFRMHHKSNARQELIDVCKEQYQNNAEELLIINEFEKTYKTENTIWCETEVLIESIHEEKEKKFWIVHITLASEDDFYLKETFAHMKDKIGDETNLHSLGKILTEIYLRNSSIGLVYWRKKLYSEALTNLNTTLKIQQATLPSEHSDILATYNRFAITYSIVNEVDLATLSHNHPDIVTSYNNIGWLYHEKIGDYVKALESFQKSLAICRKILPPTYRDIIRTEQNIRRVNIKLQYKSQS
ncbi:unnamed protein product [Adineta steineri]|uniref:Uncharacterized protein n=1 Tax=Adineta steineri TaxID=433720 RepID=A0A815BU27_9BILA|nr:unnamed protein product [Adineta steineri]CAF1277642.1 unnamed protein product [Adineta steineri]CAF3746139.1 unnamed protein product [Adineta steineri]